MAISFTFFSSYNAEMAERKVNTMKMKKPNVQKMKGTVKQTMEDTVAYCKLHRNAVIASVAAFVGGLASCIFINKKFGDENGQSEKTDERHRWQDDEDFEEATIEYGDTSIHGAWFTTGKGGKIFFAEDEDGNLP